MNPRLVRALRWLGGIALALLAVGLLAFGYSRLAEPRPQGDIFGLCVFLAVACGWLAVQCFPRGAETNEERGGE